MQKIEIVIVYTDDYSNNNITHMDPLGKQLRAELALYDLEPHLSTLPRSVSFTTKMSLEKLPPVSWDDWTKEKLLTSENANYWKSVLLQTD